MKEFEESRPPYLIIADNRITVDRERTTYGDLIELIGQLSANDKLWFSIRYTLFGEQRALRARELVGLKDLPPEEHDKYIEEKAQELLWAENINIAVGNPDQADNQDIY